MRSKKKQELGDLADLPPAMAAKVFIPPKIVTQITSLSPRSQDRLEAEGRFPRSVRLGPGINGRKGRVLQEVLDWNDDRIAEREQRQRAAAHTASPGTHRTVAAD